MIISCEIKRPIPKPDDFHQNIILKNHVDCSIKEVIGRRKNPPYAYITECDILFYSNNIYYKDNILKDFIPIKYY
jgi:hypothetical protein